MIKFIPLVALIAAILGVFSYFSFFKTTPKIQTGTAAVADPNNIENRLKTLESAVVELANKTGSSTVATSITNASPIPISNNDTRLNALEASVTDLQDRVRKIEVGSAPSSSPTTLTVVKQSPVYVLSLGSGGTTTATDWTTISAVSITIDPADYPGYTSMQLEAQIKVLSGNGKAFARLYESSNGLSVLSSEVSTSAENYSWSSSSAFTLSSGKKTFVFQLKSLTGYEAAIQSARIKVNF